MGSSDRSFRLSGGDALAVGVAFAAAMITLMLMLAAPTGAQNAQAGEGPPAGTPVTASNPDDPDSPPNLFVIPARGCTVSEGASITLEESDGTRAKFVDGRGVDITATASQISMKITGDQFLSDVATFPDPNDQSFDTGNEITLVTTTGISCQGTGTPADEQPADDNAAAAQYGAQDKEITVLVETIPDKKVLVDTGGPGFATIGMLLLGLGFVGLGLLVLRRV